MQKVIRKDTFKAALSKRGWTQSALAKAVGVTPQAVTNWLKGVDFPRPDKLLKLATLLKLSFDQLVEQPQTDQPIVAFRKKAGAKTTDGHIYNARGMGMLLKLLIEFLPETRVLRTLITSPTIDYAGLQSIASQVRERLGVGERAVLGYEQLIGEFKSCGAILIPVLWGKKQQHKNALHILLPRDDVAFVFLNLDTRLEDFKFWMAHELAHVYTPDLAGKNEGEDFADAFSGSLLFPQACAELAYSEVMAATKAGEIAVLQAHAAHHSISLNTVYQQVKQYAKAKGFSPLRVTEKTIHAVRNSGNASLVSEALFDPLPPKPAQYLAACENTFQSDFFMALKRMIKERGTGPSYVQQVLDIALQDAVGVHQELTS